MDSVSVHRALPGVHPRELRVRLRCGDSGLFWALGVDDRWEIEFRIALYYLRPVLYRRGLHQRGEPTAWMRIGVQSGREFANSYLFLFPGSVCVVYDRPNYPRVKGRQPPVNESGECAQSLKARHFCRCLFPACGERACLVRAAPDREARTSGASDTWVSKVCSSTNVAFSLLQEVCEPAAPVKEKRRGV